MLMALLTSTAQGDSWVLCPQDGAWMWRWKVAPLWSAEEALSEFYNPSLERQTRVLRGRGHTGWGGSWARRKPGAATPPRAQSLQLSPPAQVCLTPAAALLCPGAGRPGAGAVGEGSLHGPGCSNGASLPHPGFLLCGMGTRSLQQSPRPRSLGCDQGPPAGLCGLVGGGCQLRACGPGTKAPCRSFLAMPAPLCLGLCPQR